MPNISETALKVLGQIESFRDAQIARMNAVIAAGHFADIPNVRASRWVNVSDLRRAFPSIRRDTLAALVKRGALLQRKSGGRGPEVFVTRSASADELAEARALVERQAREDEAALAELLAL